MQAAIPPDLTEFLRWFRSEWEISGNGIPERDLDEIERREGVRLPTDLRAVLRTLPPGRQGLTNLRIRDWRVPGLHAATQAELLDGLEFDVESGWLWNPEWGPHDVSRKAAGLEALRSSFESAPRLVPAVCGYVLEDESLCGCVAFGVNQSDVIVLASDIRTSILAGLRLIDHTAATRDVPWDAVARVPFWGALIDPEDRWHRDPAGW